MTTTFHTQSSAVGRDSRGARHLIYSALFVASCTTATAASAEFAASPAHALTTSRHPEAVAIEARTRRNIGLSSYVMELRRLSGLTWDRLANLFGVSRRAVHAWASGGAMNQRNAAHLHQCLAAMRAADRGSASENRTILIDVMPTADGCAAFDALRDRDYDQAKRLLGQGSPRARVRIVGPDEAERLRRLPPPPDALVASLEEPVIIKRGRWRRARVAKVGGGRGT